jgi:hypothetical protein
MGGVCSTPPQEKLPALAVSKDEIRPLIKGVDYEPVVPDGKDPASYLQFDATQTDEDNALLVIVFPLNCTVDEDFSTIIMDESEHKRRDLLARLTKAGLKYSSMLAEDKDEAYIIIHADNCEPRLMEAAEFTYLELRLKKEWEVPYSPFTIDRQDDFVWEDRANNKLFSTRDKQTLIMGILETGDFDTVDEMAVTNHDQLRWKDKYGKEKLPTCGLDLDTYLNDDIITGYFATHGHNRRDILLAEWASKFTKAQPLEMIFEYFNSKTAIYFGFIGYYSMWLAYSSVLGLAVTAYGYGFEPPKHQTDNRYVMIFAFVMAFWGTLFLEYWKRYNAELAYRWSVVDLQKEARERSDYRRGCGDLTRPGFYTYTGHFVPYDTKLDPESSWMAERCCGVDFFGSLPLTYAPEDQKVDMKTKAQLDKVKPPQVPFMDANVRWRRTMSNLLIASLFIFGVLAILMSFLVIRLVFQKMINAKTGATVASIAQALCTVLLNMIYKEIAVCMVDYENYRTDMEWENAIVQKVFPFQFINSYFSLFYIAFLKGKIGTLDGYDDQCKGSNNLPSANCMYELNTLLLSTLVTTQIAGTIAEAMLPYVSYKLQLWAEEAKTGDKDLSEITKQTKLTPCHPLDAFNDYNKMVIQFGYVTMFVAAFPLAPACALLNNVLEIRTDAWRRLVAMQRPAFAMRAENIGEWMQVLEFMSMAAVATNVGVLCFTSDHLATTFKFTGQQRVWAFIILEHAVVLVKLGIANFVTDRPEWVTLKLARDEYMLAHREEIISKEKLGEI